MRKKIRLAHLKTLIILGISAMLILSGIVFVFAATLQTPDLGSFDARKVAQSTKIYDRTGKILLYDLSQNIQRTNVSFDQISPFLKQATISIEDANFYNHGGIEPLAILRAAISDTLLYLHLSSGYTQGGSTITQQVIKNSILVQDRTISRKLKEWILAIKLEQKYSKDQILGFYLNESPYGGSIYGVEEASQSFFGKDAKDIDLAEAAYIAALPQAPTYYSPYGNHRDALDARKNLVLAQMLKYGYISNDQYTEAKNEQVVFLPQRSQGILAPHFVFYVQEYLENKYGSDAVENEGLKVITTLDYTLQQKAEEIVKQYALQNQKDFNASNAALVAIDPKTGEILTMVGSRDYFDPTIDGNFNVAVQANRQPGSSFKPFIYATAFAKGYTPDTVLFDVPTQFSVNCAPNNFTSSNGCYSPVNYDGKFRGPMTLRDALAQSINIPAVKLFYLAGLTDSLKTAQAMGIQSLGNISQYGLTLVLGGGEVSLIDMTSAYGVFADEGVRNPYTPILEVEDSKGNVLEKFTPAPTQVLDRNVALTVSDVLDDNVARTPSYGTNSPLYFPGYTVAAKTGTTNETKDAWILGYTPQIAVGAWAGNNDDSPMVKQVAGLIVAPLWSAFMKVALANDYGTEQIEKPLPNPNYNNLKPILRGFWQGGETVTIDKTTGNPATPGTPPANQVEEILPGVHSILYWVDKNDPLGPPPADPTRDGQFANWEYGVQKWLGDNHINPGTVVVPGGSGGVNSGTSTNTLSLTLTSPAPNASFGRRTTITVIPKLNGTTSLSKVDFYADGAYLGSASKAPFIFSFTPDDFSLKNGTVTLSATAFDSVLNQGSASVSINVHN
jgi:1A family penicillin-binding protein